MLWVKILIDKLENHELEGNKYETKHFFLLLSFIVSFVQQLFVVFYVSGSVLCIEKQEWV